MASASRLALFASSLKTSERSLVPSWTKSYEWLEKKCDLASFTILESRRKASARLGLSEANQVETSHLLELDGLSFMALGVVSSIDMLPCGSGEGFCLFSHGDHLGTGMGEAAKDACSSAGGTLVGGAAGGDRGDHPNKTW